MSYPRETKEFQPFQVTVSGVSVLTGVEIAVLPPGVRPTVWVPPETLDSQLGVMVNGFAPGIWIIWARVTSVPEIPVLYCGDFKVT